MRATEQITVDHVLLVDGEIGAVGEGTVSPRELLLKADGVPDRKRLSVDRTARTTQRSDGECLRGGLEIPVDLR